MRRFVFCICIVLAVQLAGGARAQTPATWPDRPIRVIVTYAAGGITDILARVITQKLSDKFKYRFVVDNRPGATSRRHRREIEA